MSAILPAARFSSLESAKRFRSGCIQPAKFSFVNGNDGRVWMVTNREASILNKCGIPLLQG